jgi:Protein of unknown function (DUF2934)
MKMHHESEKPAGEEAGTSSYNPIKASPRQVSEQAYFYYLNAGSSHGHDLEHWFRAEKDLMAGQSRTTSHGAHN